MTRILGQAERDPGDHQSQQRTAGVAQEHLGPRPPWQAHVPRQERSQRAAQEGLRQLAESARQIEERGLPDEAAQRQELARLLRQQIDQAREVCIKLGWVVPS